MIYIIKLILVFILAETLADLENFLTLKKQFNHHKTANEQNKKQNGQQVEIAFNKMPDRCPELVDKGCNQKKPGRTGQY